jgi:hypothetical protein
VSEPERQPAPALRIGDRERHRTVDALSAAFADGRLTPEEFDERSTAALAARTADDLTALTADLGVTASAQPVAQPTVSGRRGERSFIAVMSGAVRKGRWQPGEQMTAVAIMGGVELDFRSAVVAGPELSMTAVAIMGGIDITVPDDWAVSMSGLSLMGGRDGGGDPVTGEPVVHLHVSAWAVMGGIVVRHKPREFGTGGWAPIEGPR